MRHQVAFRKLSRSVSHRRALLRNMVTSLLRVERFETTLGKAKELRPVTEKIITLGKRGDLNARRQAFAYLQDKAVVHKLFAILGPRYQERNGGYTRVVRTGYRHGDAAPLAFIELIDDERFAREQQSKATSTKSKAKAPQKAGAPEESSASPKATKPKASAAKAKDKPAKSAKATKAASSAGKAKAKSTKSSKQTKKS